jgi:hypothetical protein
VPLDIEASTLLTQGPRSAEGIMHETTKRGAPTEPPRHAEPDAQVRSQYRLRGWLIAVSVSLVFWAIIATVIWAVVSYLT